MVQIFRRIIVILIFPRLAWQIIREEKTSTLDLFLGYAAIIVAIPAISKIIGRGIVGVDVNGLPYRMVLSDAIFGGVIQYLLYYIGLILVTIVIHTLARYFIDFDDNFNITAKLVVYSGTALYVAGIFLMVPSISIMYLFSVYSLYILYRGITVMYDLPPDRGLIFMMMSMIALILAAFFCMVLSDHFFYMPHISGPVIF